MTTKEPTNPAPIESPKKLSVGIVMPISPMEDCGADHWVEVKTIIGEAIESITDYECEYKIVSENDAVGLIHQNIVQGLYNSDVVVCDVSCKNANVMFELGMRLAFDKPTIIIKDDRTSYSFDTSGIEHVEYPRDLRFGKIVTFKESLANKIRSTHEYSKINSDHSPFLKAFGPFTAITPSQNQIPAEQYIIETLKKLTNDFSVIKRQINKDISNSQEKSNKISDKTKLLIRQCIMSFIQNEKLDLKMEIVPLAELIEYIEDQLDRSAFDEIVSKRNLVSFVKSTLSQAKIPYIDNLID